MWCWYWKCCRQLFKDYQILAVTSLYVLEVICFVKNYKFSLEQNVHVHDYDMREKKEGFTGFAV
jgi:hypothetical protein